MKRVVCLNLILAILMGVFCVNANENSVSDNPEKSLLIDDCIDFSVVTDHSENIYADVTTEENKYAFDDFTMFMRSTATDEWLEYAVPENQYLIFNTYFRQNEEISHFTFFWSEDKEIWNSFSPQIEIKTVESWRWIPVIYDLKKLDSRAEFVRIVFGNIDGTVWSPAVSGVYSRYKNDDNNGFIDCVDTSFYDATAFLKNLGLISGANQFEFKPYNAITRAEFAKLTTSVLNVDISVSSEEGTVFKDTKSDHWAFDQIMSLWYLGIVNGDENGYFKPDDVITMNEAIKIIISALGYTELAEEKGGYPSGYIYAAKQIDLFDEADGHADMVLNRGTAAVLFANALNSEVLYQVGFGSDKEYRKDKSTVLNKYHDIYEIEGVLTNVGSYSIISDSLYSNDTAVIDEQEYKFDIKNLEKFLGHEVAAYVKHGKNNAVGRIIYVQSLSRTIIISADKYEGLNNGYICYEETTGKIDKIKYDNNTRVILNGRYSTRMGVIDHLDFTCGYMTLVKNSGKAVIDTVIIQNYQTYIMKSDNRLDGVLSDKTGITFSIDFDKANTVKLSLYEDETEFSSDLSVKAGDTLSVAISEDGYVAEIHVSNTAISGLITNIYDDYFCLNNEKVFLSEKIKKENVSSFLGKEIKVYTDINQQVVYIESDGTNLEYGYLQAVSARDTFSKKVYYRILSLDGSIKEYYADSKTNYNGNKDRFETLKELVPQLIKFTANETGRILKLETALITDGHIGEKTFSRNYKSEYCTYYGDNLRLFASIFQLDDDTKIFFVPSDKENVVSYEVKKLNYLINNNGYNIELYDTDSRYVVDAAVIYEDGSDSRTLENYDNIGVITETANILDSEGRLCIHIIAKVNGQDTDIYFDNEGGTDITADWISGYIARDTANGNIPFKKGEVFQYYMDEESHCKFFRMMLTENMIDENDYYEKNVGDYGAITKENFFSELYSMFGIVKDKFPEKIITETKNGYLRTFPVKDAPIYIVDAKRKSVLKGDKADISIGDEVFVYMSYTSVKGIVILK